MGIYLTKVDIFTITYVMIYQNRLTANTIFQDTHKPLSMWWITSQKAVEVNGKKYCL